MNDPMPSRLPGPASTDPDLTYLLLLDGTQTWSLNRELHRPDGPAVISPDGTRQYFLYGRVVTPATHAYYNNPDPANVSLLPTFEERYNLVTLRQFAYEHRRDLVLAESDRDQLLQAFLAFATGEEIARLAADTADDPEIQAQISELVLFISSL